MPKHFQIRKFYKCVLKWFILRRGHVYLSFCHDSKLFGFSMMVICFYLHVTSLVKVVETLRHEVSELLSVSCTSI